MGDGHKDWRGHSVVPDGLEFLHAASGRIYEDQQRVSHRKYGEGSLHWISCLGGWEKTVVSVRPWLALEAGNTEGVHHERFEVYQHR